MPLYMRCPFHPEQGDLPHGYTDGGPFLIYAYHTLPDGSTCTRYTTTGYKQSYPTQLEAYEAEVFPRYRHDKVWVAAMRARLQGREKVAARLFIKWHKQQGTYIEPTPPPTLTWAAWRAEVVAGLSAHMIELDDMPDEWDLAGWHEDGTSVDDAISDILYDLGIPQGDANAALLAA